METIQTITLTATNFKIPATVHAVQNDTGRLLRMIVADQELQEGATAELAVKRSDGSYYNIECELEAEYNSFIADLTQALTQPGDTACQLKVDGLVSSYMFVVSVQADVSGVSVPQMGIYPQTLLDAADQIMYAQNDVKLALLQFAEKAAYSGMEYGQEVYDALLDALYPPVRATSVVLSQNSLLFETVGLTKTLTATVLPAETSEKVVWGSSDTSVCRVANGVVTSVGDGSCTITATAGMVSASCNVVVSSAVLVGIEAVYTQGGIVYGDASLDDLKADLVVTAEFSDESTIVLSDEDYTLSGSLVDGTSAITVTYGVETTTFDVNVTWIPSEYQEIEFIEGTGTQYITTDLLSQLPMSLESKIAPTVGDSGQFAGAGISSVGNSRFFLGGIGVQNNTSTINYISMRASDANQGYAPGVGQTTTNWVRALPELVIGNSYTFVSGIETDGTQHIQVEDFEESRLTKKIPAVGYPFYFMYQSNVPSPSLIRIYYAKLFTGSTMLFYGIPCRRKSDSEGGLYDLVADKFYGNSGSGTFVLGNDVDRG